MSDDSNPFKGLGTFFVAPYCSPEQRAQDQARHAAEEHAYAEQVADRIIGEWQSSGEVTIERLKSILITTIKDWGE